MCEYEHLREEVEVRLKEGRYSTSDLSIATTLGIISPCHTLSKDELRKIINKGEK